MHLPRDCTQPASLRKVCVHTRLVALSHGEEDSGICGFGSCSSSARNGLLQVQPAQRLVQHLVLGACTNARGQALRDLRAVSDCRNQAGCGNAPDSSPHSTAMASKPGSRPHCCPMLQPCNCSACWEFATADGARV